MLVLPVTLPLTSPSSVLVKKITNLPISFLNSCKAEMLMERTEMGLGSLYQSERANIYLLGKLIEKHRVVRTSFCKFFHQIIPCNFSLLMLHCLILRMKISPLYLTSKEYLPNLLPKNK